MRFFSFAYSCMRSCFESFSYRGMRRNVRNLRRIVSMTSFETIRNSSISRRLARLPLALSLAVTTLIYDEFLKTILASVPLIRDSFSLISFANSGEFGLSSSRIFSKTLSVFYFTIAFVFTLNGHRDPSAIAGFVIPVHIYSVYRAFSLRSRVIISVAICPLLEFGIVLPFITKMDTPTTIIFITRIVWVGASIDHIIINFVQPIMRTAMDYISSLDMFFIQATARFRMPSLKTVLCSNRIASAITMAAPLDEVSPAGAYIILGSV